MKKLTLFIIIIVLGLIFFFPKPSGGGGSCLGCENTECKCFGFQKNWVAKGPWRSTCYGIPYGCETYIFGYLDETANWKTYRNEEYGFEFKYPNNWSIEDLSGIKDILVYIDLRPPENIDCGCGFHRFFIGVDEKTITEHRTTLGYTTIEAEEETKISGKKGIKQMRKHDGELIYIFFPVNSDKTLQLVFGDDCDEDDKDICDKVMNQILSTFRFIK